MTKIKFVTYLILNYCVYFSKSDECVTFDFENDVENLFINDKGMCTDRNWLPWNVVRYVNIDLKSPHYNSMAHVSAPAAIGCGSTFEFTMTGSGTISSAPSGIIEANVYVDFNSTFGYLIMDVVIIMADGSHNFVGEASVASYDANVVTGWQTLMIDRIGRFGTNRGFLTFIGRGQVNSVIIVDSFRYIPPDMDKDSCVIYKDKLTPIPTTESTTETIVTQYTTTELTDDSDKCVKYNFESDFDIFFPNDNNICSGLLPWQRVNYTDSSIESPNSSSTKFISPHENLSCISSIVYKMEPGGRIEAYVFMEPVLNMDHIIIQLYKATEYNTIAGFTMYYQENERFVFGWNVIDFTLLGASSFDGYVVFIGSAHKNSTVLVDWVRYIPPLRSPEDVSCNVY